MPRPQKSYKSMEEFDREELRSSRKCGFSVEDLLSEAVYQEHDLVVVDDDVQELDFD